MKLFKLQLSDMKSMILLAGISLAVSAYSQDKVKTFVTDPNWDMRDHPLDMIHLRAELSFDAPKGLVKGKITHRFKPLREKVDSFYLDGPSVRIKEASLSGKPLRFRQDSAGYWFFPETALSWNRTDSVTLVYEANPRRGLYFVGWNDPKNMSRKQIWSQGQGIDNRHWLPMYDEMNDKITSELLITFDKDYKVLSNGNLLSSKEKDGMKVWHYKMTRPHAPYLIMMAAGKYEIRETKSQSGVPMFQYYYPEWKDRVPSAYRHSEQMMDFFEKEIAVKYPWETYSQVPVQDYMFGAMENTTATVFGDFSFVDERAFIDKSYVSTNAHELAHQWFGDFITARSSRHHWLQESFATYYSQLFERDIYGNDFFDWSRRLANNQALDASKKDKMPVANSEAGTVRHYPKGAFVLNMLKNVVGGREIYNKAITHYLKKHPYGNVDSNDLLVAFEEVSGMPLDWFWEQWVYKGGEPSYKVQFRQYNSQGGQEFLEFHVSQVHERNDLVGLFKMPVWTEIVFADGSKSRKQTWIQKEHEIITIPNPEKKPVSFVLFDPNSEVLKSIDFKKPIEMLKIQAVKAESMLDRFDAVVAMRDIPFDRKFEILQDVFAKEKFHAVKAEIISQIVNVNDPRAHQLIRSGIAAPEVQVRKATLAIKKIPGELLAEYEKLLKDQSYETVTAALEHLCMDKPEKTMEYLEATKGVEGTRGRIVIVKWLELACLYTKDKKFHDQLVDLSSGSYEFQTRVNAINALRRLNVFDQAVLENLIDAGFSGNNRLANPAIDVLKDFAAVNEYRKMISGYIESKNFTQPWQKAMVRRILS